MLTADRGRDVGSFGRSGYLAEAWLIGGLAAWWLCLLHLPWRYNGGWGTDLPFNLLAWGIAGGLIAGCAVLLPLRSWQGGRTGNLLIAGALLMSLPLLWSPSALARESALPRIVGLWGSVLFWLTLRQCRFSYGNRLLLLSLLAAAGGIQTCQVLLELFGPASWLPETSRLLIKKYGRYGAGIFGQANVTASFLAMSLGLMLLLSAMRGAVLSSCRREFVRQVVLAVGIVLTTAVLVLLRSRTGWLGGCVVAIGIVGALRLPRFRQTGHYRWRLTVLLMLGVVIGMVLLNVSLSTALMEHDGSNRQRLITLYNTLMMMKRHPLSGYGAGTYEAVYQNYVASLPGGNPGLEMMNYPHNELLYQYAEGGVVGLSGVLLWGIAWGALWRQKLGICQAGILVSMIPVLLHSQVEYPFYYSVAHVLAMLQLAVLAEMPEKAAVRTLFTQPPAGGRHRGTFLLRAGIVVLALYGSVTALWTLHSGQVLGRFERQRLPDPESIVGMNVPWVLQPRYQHDLSLLRLIQFRSVPDPNSLRMFVVENSRWLSVHADDDMYRNQIVVLRYLAMPGPAFFWQMKAKKMFPWEAGTFSGVSGRLHNR